MDTLFQNELQEKKILLIIPSFSQQMYLQTKVEVVRPLSVDDLFLALCRRQLRVREHRRQRRRRVLTHFLGFDSRVANTTFYSSK